MRVLITGITGTIGTELTKRLLQEGHTVTGLSRDELKQSKFEYKNDVELCLGDVRDFDAVVRATRKADQVIHTAALKHVDLMEINPHESIKTNVLATENILNAQTVNDIPRVTMLSTDKAVYPINVYGHSKAISERLVMARSRNNQIIRYGNVLNSRGSVIDIFRRQLITGGPAKITDPRMTRFWIRIQDAAEFIMNTIFKSTTGVHVPEMKGSSVRLLADAVISNIHGMDCAAKYETVGMRPGEKINECLKSRYETVTGNDDPLDVYSDRVEQFTLAELRDLIGPLA